MVCLFSFLTVLSEVLNFLIKSSLSTFLFVTYICVISKRPLPNPRSQKLLPCLFIFLLFDVDDFFKLCIHLVLLRRICEDRNQMQAPNCYFELKLASTLWHSQTCRKFIGSYESLHVIYFLFCGLDIPK